MAHSELYRLPDRISAQKRFAIETLFDRYHLHTIADLDHVSVSDINAISQRVRDILDAPEIADLSKGKH